MERRWKDVVDNDDDDKNDEDYIDSEEKDAALWDIWPWRAWPAVVMSVVLSIVFFLNIMLFLLKKKSSENFSFNFFVSYRIFGRDRVSSKNSIHAELVFTHQKKKGNQVISDVTWEQITNYKFQSNPMKIK